MARNLSGVLVAAAVTLATGCQTLPTSGGDPAGAVSSISAKSLPADGSWVRYVVSHESTSHPYRGRKAKSDANVETVKVKRWSEKITLSFVGQTVENGVPCRWVEIRIERSDQQADKPCGYKMLLKEEGLLSDKHPLAEKNVLRVWQQMPDGTVSRRDDSLGYSDLFSWTPGAVRHLKPAGETREIDFATCHLSSATAYSGMTTTNAHVALGVIRIHLEEQMTVWLHPDLPAGFAGMRMEENSTARFMTHPATLHHVAEYVLEDAGTDAQTSMPEHN
jgi:hypothetical protein